jgi:ATP-dependent helicase/nuclease subunit B
VAKVDRIDRLKNGSLIVIDYKTGQLPRQGDVALGFSPQLPLEAVIATLGGFDGVTAAPVADLEYWRLCGGEKGGEVKRVKTDDVMALAAEARLGLVKLIKSFSSDDAAYVASPRADYQLAFNDYAHLARQDEWAETEGD